MARRLRGTESGRSGNITFIISARGDSAFGDVLMVSSTNPGTLQPAYGAKEHMAHVRSSQAPRIDFTGEHLGADAGARGGSTEEL